MAEVITPYQSTIIYNSGNIFETFISILSNNSDRVQIIDKNAISSAEEIEQISPELVLFGEYTAEQLQQFYGRGFQFIHLFSESADLADTAAISPSKFAVFNSAAVYEHIILEGLNTMYLAEHILVWEYSNYETVFNAKEITAVAAQCLLRAIEFSSQSLFEMLPKLQKGPTCCEQVKQLVIRGQVLAEVAVRQAILALDRSYIRTILGHSCRIINAAEHLATIINLSAKYPLDSAESEYLIIGYFSPRGLKINLVANCDSEISSAAAAEILSHLSAENIVNCGRLGQKNVYSAEIAAILL